MRTRQMREGGHLTSSSLLPAPARLPLWQRTASLLVLTIVDRQLGEKNYLFRCSVLSSKTWIQSSYLVIKLSIPILELVHPNLNQQLIRKEKLDKEATPSPCWHIHQHLLQEHIVFVYLCILQRADPSSQLAHSSASFARANWMCVFVF